MSVLYVKDQVVTKLQTSSVCSKGIACLKNEGNNAEAKIQDYNNITEYLQVEVSTCGFRDNDPVFGSCIAIRSNYEVVLETTGFKEETGKISEKVVTLLPTLSVGNMVEVDVNQYTTNSPFLGHLANVLSYDFFYYQPKDFSSIDGSVANLDTSLNCFSWATFTGNTCTFMKFKASGKINEYNQNFDDITAPILFFVSLIETLFFLIYFSCIKNYDNNAFYLRIGDSVVYMEDGNHHHYNFKSGPSVFLACLFHENPLVVIIDAVLYRVCST